MDRKLPLVVILGATGSGKTKLSLELAQRFKGEIIGADSMQIYKGLDIITAKARKDEQQLIKHHMIDVLEPHETFTVVEYRNRALKIIDDLFNRRTLPIIVGGTNYYIESLLWKILIPNTDQSNAKTIDDNIENDLKLTNEELHKKLMQYDPNMAKRLHPNNTRKIRRSLEIFYQTGRKHSDLIAEQQNSDGGSLSGGGLRYRNALIFKLHCQQEILDNRLNDRVDQMIKDGLVDELTQFHSRYNQQRIGGNVSMMPDYTKGVFQSIGLKEFHDYLMMSDEQRATDEGGEIFKRCVDELKMVTRRYARRQEKWTRNRFLGRSDRDVPPMYSLDVTDLTKWDENVLNPAIDILNSFIFGLPCNHQPLSKIVVDNQLSSTNDDTFICTICDRIFIGDYQWMQHLRSHKHKRMLERKRRLEKLEN